jgi:hypothetical protein
MRTLVLLLVGLYATASSDVKQPTFSARQDYGATGGIQAADVNGDKIPDAIPVSGDRIMDSAGQRDGAFDVDRSTAAASPKMPNFSARRDYLGLFGGYVQVADTNGDGIPDMIVATAGTGKMQVLLGAGDGTFEPGPSSYTPAPTIYQFAAVDLNGDGVVDIVESGRLGPPQYAPGIGVSLGNGDGTFQSGAFYQIADTQAAGLVVGDFNNDGIPDVHSPERWACGCSQARGAAVLIPAYWRSRCPEEPGTSRRSTSTATATSILQ